MNDPDSPKHVIIYTDGGCIGNPGPGGYGVVLLHGGHRKELSAGYRLTTNNRMELQAAIVALEALKSHCQVTVYSDSKYLVDAMKSGSAWRWREHDWRRNPAKAQKVKNPDLWEKLLQVCEKHEVSFQWVKGHANIPENERCDELSMTAAKADDVAIDRVYEQENPTIQSRTAFDYSRSTDSAGPLAKVTQEGQPCRKCGEPVVKRTPRTRRNAGQSYYYEYYLSCPQCGTNYMVDDAKRYFDQSRS